ncbi:Putative ribosomal N-acetyltransferase YdaF [Metalysinibacillus saudimassiliensis]|uniref:Putative ribosomal N-acetyltransferase YdaF n=1 Tax=Metalysinibacillus saudimassiliensis TaxID=1461583 RepID=A0A078LY78_9BACL|nr:Putative ribosomal N-acetyltransferase YdaF [Metalysinibacillus saudimassiliensis]
MFVMTVNDKVSLQLLEPQHAAALFAIVDREREYLRQWLGWLDNKRSVQTQALFIGSGLKQFAEGKGLTTGILYEGELCGTASITSYDPITKTATLGYWLSESYTGKGIATDVVRALMDYCFFERGVEVVEIRAAVGNIKSRAIAERLGFTWHSTAHNAENLYGRWVDHAVYQMTRKDYNHY